MLIYESKHVTVNYLLWFSVYFFSPSWIYFFFVGIRISIRNKIYWFCGRIITTYVRLMAIFLLNRQICGKRTPNIH